MVKTDNFVQNMIAKGFVDEADFVASGYDIKLGKDVISVRTKGERALIWNHKDSKLVEVKSARLDDVLHRYIVLSCVGKTSGTTKLGKFNNVVFIPQGVVNGKVVMKDALGREWIANSNSAKVTMDMFNECNNVSADDCMLLVDGFEPYVKGCKVESSVDFKDDDAELRAIKSSVCIDGYAVYPKSDSINKVGTTLVGSFLASATDRANVELFENLELELGAKKELHATNSSIADYKTEGVAEEVRQAIVSSGKVKAFDEFCEKTYGNGITAESLDSALVYDTGKIYSSLGITKSVEHFKPIVQSMLKESDSAYIRLDSNKDVKVVAQSANKFSAMFSAIPNIEVIKNALVRDGYTLQDLEQGMTVALDCETLGAIMNSAMDFCPISEKAYLGTMHVKTLIGSAVGKELEKFGIHDTNRAFTNMKILTVD